MPIVMLKRSWPGNFRRTITVKGRGGKETKRVLEFSPGVPVDLTAEEVEAMMPDIGTALQPVELDERARPRIIHDAVGVDQVDIHDAVGVDQVEVVHNAAQHADK